MIPPTSDPSTTLVLRRTFTASRKLVFQAWTEEHALQFWFKPKGMNITVRLLEARVGGSFHFNLENGSSIFGTYLHVAPPEKLVFTWSGTALQDRETVITLDFLEKGRKETEMVLTHEGLSTPDLHALVESGWPSLLNRLAEILFTFSKFE